MLCNNCIINTIFYVCISKKYHIFESKKKGIDLRDQHPFKFCYYMFIMIIYEI